MLDGNSIDLVESFTYLGSVQTSDGYCRPEITCVISLAYDTRCYFNVRSKADMSQLNLPHGNN